MRTRDFNGVSWLRHLPSCIDLFIYLFIYLLGPPANVEMIDLPTETEKTEVTLTWNEPRDNGAPITKYTVYQRNGIDGLPRGWIKIKEKTNLLDRKFVVQKLEKDKVYEFAVTATNKHGESLITEKSMTKIKVLGGKYCRICCW